MSMGESAYDRVNDYGAVKVRLASPSDIRSRSFGEIKKPETINYRTYRPEKDGLFCEKIFGPEKDWECACGKFRGMKYKGMVCDRCGVKVTHSRVRRKRTCSQGRGYGDSTGWLETSPRGCFWERWIVVAWLP